MSTDMFRAMQIAMQIALLCAALLTGCGDAQRAGSDGHDHGHGESHGDEPIATGPHGGRLLESGNFALEITIYERGVPPEYRLYAYRKGQALDPATVNATVTLTRLDGETNMFEFSPSGDYLRSGGTVEEPHSFDVEVEAEVDGQTHQWRYASHEGRVRIADDLARAAGIETALAAPGTVQLTRSLYGRIAADPARVAQVRARFPGLITVVNVSVGDVVKQGQVVATVEANDSLQSYELRAPINGVVTQRMASAGEIASDGVLLTIADYSSVWAHLSVFPGDAKAVKVGQPVTLHGDGEPASGTIDWIAPMGADGPVREARVVLKNIDGRWAPGMTVRGEVVVDTAEAELVVENRALQAFRDFTVVFEQIDETYEVRMLELGSSDGQHTQVLGGLKPGARYVTGNSYLIKADIEKSGASHHH